ncbi:MAG: BsuPI-related putative proteinase inhibitor [bacterium]
MNSSRLVIISLLCAGALAFACGPRSHSEPGTLAAAQTLSIADKPVEHTRRATTKNKTAKLEPRLTVDVARKTVRFAFDVANVGNKHVELSFPTGKSYDIVVVDSLGREVWAWSNGRMFTQGVQNKQLDAGDAMKVAETWSGPAQSGAYTAIATLNSSNFHVEQRVDFVVP